MHLIKPMLKLPIRQIDDFVPLPPRFPAHRTGLPLDKSLQVSVGQSGAVGVGSTIQNAVKRRVAAETPPIDFISLYNFSHKPKPPQRAAYVIDLIWRVGGATRDRTADLLNAIQVFGFNACLTPPQVDIGEQGPQFVPCLSKLLVLQTCPRLKVT